MYLVLSLLPAPKHGGRFLLVFVYDPFGSQHGGAV